MKFSWPPWVLHIVLYVFPLLPYEIKAPKAVVKYIAYSVPGDFW